jgi:hypothetical protein
VQTLRNIILACISSILIYLLVFAFFINKPLSMGFINEAQLIRANYVQAKPGPKLVIIAGSNGLFSHRAETMEKILNLPCLNASITAEFGLDIQIDLAKKWLAPRDIVLMPLEYLSYTSTRNSIENSPANGFIINYAKWLLHDYDWHRVLCTMFYFDTKYLISGVVEMSLKAVGVTRRFNTGTLTPEGDMRGHTELKGREYRKYVMSVPQGFPDPELLHKRFLGEIILTNFLKWAKERNIRVIGTLPTVFNDQPISEAAIAKIASIYQDQGQEFLLLPNRSQYDRHYFYDSNYHLNEENQIAHSQLIARYLQPRLHVAQGCK